MTNKTSGSKTNSNLTMTTLNDSFLDLSAALDVATVVATKLAKKVVDDTVTKAVKVIAVREKFPQPSERLQRMAEPSMKSYVNLYNDHRSVLKPDKVLRLEQKLADMRKYSQVVSDDLKVLIVDKVNGITANQGNLLQIKIMECVESYQQKPDETAPRFLETSYNFKCLKVVCADEQTVNWLKRIIPTLKPWPEARLEVTFMSTYSVYSTVSRPSTPKSKPNEGRVKFAIPNSSAATAKAVTFDEIKNHLATYNTLKKPDSWKELWKEDKGAYTVYFVSMGLDCIDEIRKKGNRLFYKLGAIKVAPLNQNEEIACKRKLSDDKKAAIKAAAGKIVAGNP